MREPVYYSGSAEFFDTHAHIYDRKYADCNTSVEDILQRCRASGVTSMLIPADSEETSRLAIELAVKYDGFEGMKLYSSCGVHPHEAKTYTEDTEKYLRECLEHREEKKIRALGEIGLDYYYDLSERSVQREVFEKQLILAKEYDVPFILHERDATGDCLEAPLGGSGLVSSKKRSSCQPLQSRKITLPLSKQRVHICSVASVMFDCL